MSKDFSEITDYILNRIVAEKTRVAEQTKTKPIRNLVEVYDKMQGNQPFFIEALRQDLTEKYGLNAHEIDNLFESLTKEEIIEIKEKSIIISVKGNSILQAFGTYSNYKKTDEKMNKTKNPDSYWTSPKTIILIFGIIISIIFNSFQYRSSRDNSDFNIRKLVCDSMLTVQQMKVADVRGNYNSKVQENIDRLQQQLETRKEEKQQNLNSEIKQSFTGIDEEGLKMSDRGQINARLTVKIEALEFAIKKLNEIKE